MICTKWLRVLALPLILTLSHPVLLVLYQLVAKVIIIMTCIVRHCLWEQLLLIQQQVRTKIYISAGSDLEISPDGEVEAVTEVMTTGFVSPTITAVQSP